MASVKKEDGLRYVSAESYPESHKKNSARPTVDRGSPETVVGCVALNCEVPALSKACFQ